MAKSNEGKGGEEGRLSEDPLVAALVPDPSAGPPDCSVLHGYVGKSPNANCWRLYLDATLTSYVEVSESDILHHRQAPDEGGTYVWLPKSLDLKVTTVTSTVIQAEFLSGAIAAGRIQTTRRRVSGISRDTVPSVGCPSILNSCLSRILPCPSDGCWTWGSNCHSEIDWCGPSDFRPLCTIAIE